MFLEQFVPNSKKALKDWWGHNKKIKEAAKSEGVSIQAPLSLTYVAMYDDRTFDACFLSYKLRLVMASFL